MSQRQHNTLHVNFWGNPGTGKTAAAEMLSGQLKKAGYSTELIQEVARGLALSGKLHKHNEDTGTVTEAEQFVISAEQYRREAEFDGVVEVIVTDSPVPQGLLFAPEHYRTELATILHELTAGWNSLDVLLDRNIRDNYTSEGRIQSKDESLALRPEIEEILARMRPEHIRLHVNDAVEIVFGQVVDLLDHRRFARLTP